MNKWNIWLSKYAQDLDSLARTRYNIQKIGKIWPIDSRIKLVRLSITFIDQIPTFSTQVSQGSWIDSQIHKLNYRMLSNDHTVPTLDLYLDLVVGKLLGIRYFDNVGLYHYPLSFSLIKWSKG